ncbi:hypothetical protein [uncultured Pseudokineococcus sp.]|uniref:AMIN-like domain-containing (lipo)protein n=1 Tax=uncultured Pseudokineococcus sp. TaxID=1642928 RepID=UPI002605B599|nr:hypothetical protein [uncultured Pseudokineococcus sp.]
MTPHDQRPGPRTRVPRSRAARATASGAVAAGLLALLLGCGGDGVTAGPAISPAAATTPRAPETTGGAADAGTAEGTTGAGEPDAPSTGAASTPVPSTTPASSPATDAGATPEDLRAPQEHDAGTGTSEQEAVGGGLSVVDVRTGRHEGFDRVVLELAGEDGGEPGWHAHYVDEPTQDGSGAPLQVTGSSHLAVVVRGLGYPFETGQDEVLGSTSGEGTELVREVLVGGVHEGQAQVVVGLDEEAPYRITRLADPPRVVVDVLT